ncbi:hypothetical protein GOBAR_DD16386 [Gossypium barbadense]|nr:hypothetical protein GOBAR_DD16386 [Gossypium barbadense]
MEGDKGTVRVTGVTGFIASWLIKSLLQEVTLFVQLDLSFLTSLPGAAEKLKILSADLSDPNSFDAVIEGSKAVLYVATPVDFQNKESEEAITERSINGAVGILKACLRSKTVKRVVYTSSASTVVFNGQEMDMMDESFWTDVDFVRQKLSPNAHSYIISKTLTERAVLDFGAQHGLDVVTVIPSFVVGPFICPKFPGSVRTSLALFYTEKMQCTKTGKLNSTGNQSEYSFLLNFSMVHVDDVARAHIFLLEYPDAKGRYNCSSDTISLEKLSEFLGGKYPEFPIPSPESLGEIKGMKCPGLSSKKLLETGFEFKNGVEEMFDGAIQCCSS